MKSLCYEYFPELKMFHQFTCQGTEGLFLQLDWCQQISQHGVCFSPITLRKIRTFLSSSTLFALKYNSIRSKYASIDSFSGQNLSIWPKEVMVLSNPHRHCNDWSDIARTTCTCTDILETISLKYITHAHCTYDNIYIH